MYISIQTRIKSSDWLEIRSGRGFLIYSAWQGLNQYKTYLNEENDDLMFYVPFNII